MKNKIEILAPAGSYEGMKAAMNAGCDAVYIGGSSFGARAYADNLSEDILLGAIDEAHIRGKKLYLTVNTLLKEKELSGRLYSFLDKYYRQGLDAVIVQDVGVMYFIHQNFPELPIHASTQMTLTMAQGADLLKNYGVTRVVTSRELSLAEINTMRKHTDLEIETFVHGALCYCYSGQCLMSSMIGGRSGNRGRCAQPCRMPYRFYTENKLLSKEREAYLLSPKDICTLENIPELIEAGINSFKIEGRMKRPEYAALVSSLYRKYTDLYLDEGKEKYFSSLKSREFAQDMLLLQDIYNRGGFSRGYGNSYHGKAMMSLSRPNHSGVCVGEVTAVKGREVSIRLKEKLHAQDILEIRMGEEEGYEFTIKDAHNQGETIQTITGKWTKAAERADKSTQKHSIQKTAPLIKIGNLVYRTRNNELLNRLSKLYLEEDKKQGIKGCLTARLRERLRLCVTLGEDSVTVYQDIVQEAVKQPMTKEKLALPLMKTGDTMYYFKDLTVEADDKIFVPVAWLNEIRREAVQKLSETVKAHYRRENIILKETAYNCIEQSKDYREENADKEIPASSYGMTVSVQTKEQFEAVLRYEEINTIYVDYDRLDGQLLPKMAEMAGNAGKKTYLLLPPVCRLAIFEDLEKNLRKLGNNKWISGFVVRNLEEISLVQALSKEEGSSKEIILNYNMYVFNREAIFFWRENKITRFTAPLELNCQELGQLGTQECDFLVYGYLPLMISAQCLFESTEGCRKNAQNNAGCITDRLGRKFYIQTNCRGCYNYIYNGLPLALHKQAEEVKNLKPANIRLDFTIETAKETQAITELFLEAYYKGGEASDCLTEYTTGHFKRGVE